MRFWAAYSGHSGQVDELEQRWLKPMSQSSSFYSSLFFTYYVFSSFPHRLSFQIELVSVVNEAI